jgi:hypothetical protein
MTIQSLSAHHAITVRRSRDENLRCRLSLTKIGVRVGRIRKIHDDTDDGISQSQSGASGRSIRPRTIRCMHLAILCSIFEIQVPRATLPCVAAIRHREPIFRYVSSFAQNYSA